MLAITSTHAIALAHTPQHRATQPTMMASSGPMYSEPLAPSTMGLEFINKPRKPLSEYVGASVELAPWNGGSMRGSGAEPWDPLQLSDLWKVSANNPDAAWLRHAELKHGRMAMLAFAGILMTNGGVHFPPGPDGLFLDSNWVTAPATLNAKSPVAIAQVFAFIGMAEGYTSTGTFDMLLGDTSIREPGDLGFDPLGLMPKDKVTADKMKLKELKNGRMAMIAVMGFAANHFLPGSVPGLQGFAP